MDLGTIQSCEQYEAAHTAVMQIVRIANCSKVNMLLRFPVDISIIALACPVIVGWQSLRIFSRMQMSQEQVQTAFLG